MPKIASTKELLEQFPQVGSYSRFVSFRTNHPEVVEDWMQVKVLNTSWGYQVAALTDEQIAVLIHRDLPGNMTISFRGVSLEAPLPVDEGKDLDAVRAELKKKNKFRRGCRVSYKEFAATSREFYRVRVDEFLSLPEVLRAAFGSDDVEQNVRW